MQPGARENIAYLTQTERRKDVQYEAMQERRDAESVANRGFSASVPTNFKDRSYCILSSKMGNG